LQVDRSELQADAALVGTMGTNANGMTGMAQVTANYGLNGKGQTIAVIDTGIAYDHPALGGGYGAGYRVVGGYDFAENDANPYDDGPSGSHGTHVAGIIGSTNATYSGVATGVDLVALRVFDDQGNGNFTWVEQALQWVHQHRNDYTNPITAINLSLGTNYNGSTVPNWAMLEDEFTQLEADGIFIAVAAGNSFASFNAPGLSYPAVSSHVVPVSALDPNGNLASYSQRASRVIAAPGSSITSTVPDYVGNLNGKTDDFATYSGTSMASPYVAGASAIIRQAMQFAGQTNITEWTIYNLMRNTADSVFDAATNTTYSKLNLQRAIDTIMPADDYGSAAQTAYQLNANGGSVALNGAIARLDDTDFFTFTAGASGTVSFTVNSQEAMVARFNTTGLNATLSQDGKTISFNVTSGQTYTFGVGTSAGIGHYTMTGTVQTGITGWGVIDYKQASGLQVTGGERWFSLSAVRSGTLTVQALFNNAGGNVDVEIYNGSGQLLGTSATANNSERVDLNVNAGDVLQIRLVGNNANVDVRVTNLIQQNGGTVTVFGTNTDDVFALTVGATHQVTINGTQYSFAGASANNIVFNGGGGNDTASLTLGAGADQITLRAGSGDVIGQGYQVHTTGVESHIVNGNGGADSATLCGSAGTDQFVTSSTKSTITGSGFSNVVNGVTQITGYGNGGIDSAYLIGTAGNDVLALTPTYGIIYGNGYQLRGYNFANQFAYAGGGADVAYLYGSAGNDVLHMYSTITGMQGSGFLHQANNFGTIYTYSGGGADTVIFADSAGNDNFLLRPDYAQMSGVGFNNFAVGFRTVVAYSTGGDDAAHILDSAGNDTLTAGRGYVGLANSALTAALYNFKRVTAYGTSGGANKVNAAAVDFVFSKIGSWN